MPEGTHKSPAGAWRQLKAVMQLSITTGSEKGLPLRLEIAARTIYSSSMSLIRRDDLVTKPLKCNESLLKRGHWLPKFC